jgi:hypothetical protein
MLARRADLAIKLTVSPNLPMRISVVTRIRRL